MKLCVDAGKCNRCGLCFKSCPQLCGEQNPSIFFCEQSECREKSCLAACERHAIMEVDGLCYFDYERCNRCGKCAEACDAISIVQGYPVKCTLCGRCVGACPARAITFQYTKKEAQELRDTVGWWKKAYEPAGIIEETSEYAVARVAGKEQPMLLLKIQELSYPEMLVLSKILGSIREDAGEATDEAVAQSCQTLAAGQDVSKIAENVRREVFGFSVLDPLLKADWLEEISVSEGTVRVYHKTHGWLETDLCTSEKKLISIVNKISKPLWRRLTLQNPRLNACLDFGRIHAMIPPVAKSACLTVRRFNRKPFSPHDLIANRTVSAEALAFLWTVIQSDANVLIVGNTGSGKTSLLNTLAGFIPKNERIIAVEETPEVNLPHTHQVRLAVNEGLEISLADLVADTLRMRPDRVIVGEVRTPEEAKALANTMLAGQGKSSLATFHGQNSREALLRLVNLGVSRFDLCAFDYLVVIRRWTDFRKKKDIRRVVEISRMKKESEGTEMLFAFDPKRDCLKRKSGLYSERLGCALHLGEKQFGRELLRREKLLGRPLDFNGFFEAVNDWTLADD